MKRRLFILRHALPESHSQEKSDHARVLTAQGELQAMSIAEKIKSSYTLAKVYSSDALRAKKTAAIVSERNGISFELAPKIYSSSPSQIKNLISKIPDNLNSAMLVGHNPSFSELVTDLTASSVRLSQAECAVLESEIDSWALFESVDWHLLEILRPDT